MLARTDLVRRLTGSLPTEVARVVMQSLTFIFIGRSLGTAGLGAYASTLAIIGFLTPFAGLTSGHWALKRLRTSSESESAVLLRGTTLILLTGPPCVLAAVLISVSWVEVSVQAAILLAVSELIFTTLTTLLSFICLSLNRPVRYFIVGTMPIATKFVASLTLIGSVAPTLEHWTKLYFVAALIAVGACVITILPLLSATTLAGYDRHDASWSLQVGLTQVSQGFVNDLDKPFVASIVDQATAGQYAATYRLMSLSYFLTKGVQTAFYPQFFSDSHRGSHYLRRLLRRALLFALSYGLTCSILAILLSPYSTLILGPEFNEVPYYVKLLALLIPLKFVQWFLADAVTGIDRQAARTILQFAAALMTAASLAVLTPIYGVEGAIYATYLAEGFFTIGLGVVLWPSIKSKK